MNRKLYWKIRKWIQTSLFKVKACLFKVVNSLSTFQEYQSFRRMIARNILSGGIKGVILAIGMLLMDSLSFMILKQYGIVEIPSVDRSIFVNVVIGSIGVAGVILGLFCANVSSIYSTRYANAPEIIAIAFQYDRLTRKCMSSIISFIIFGFAVIIETLLGLHVSWISVIADIIWAVYILVSYSVAGNRAYQLSDIYRLADDSYRVLNRVINKGFEQTFFSSDINFQNHYLKIADKRIALLKAIQKYGANENRGDITTMVEFICKNLLLIGEYWKRKQVIGKTSLWFRNKAKYQKWHFSGSTEARLALLTGTALGQKKEQNYWWFEDEIMSINHSCFEVLMDKHDYSSIYTCLSAVESLCEIAISSKEVIYYAEQVNWLKNLVNKYLVSESDSDETKKAFAGVIELISLLYLNLILKSSKYYQEINIDSITENVVKSLDTSHTVEKSPLLSGSNNKDFYEKVLTEIRIEGSRLTPTWLIKQHVAKDEYDYLNRLIEVICESIDQSFTLGKTYLERGLIFESCILLSRFFEFESKLNRFIEIIKPFEIKLKEYQIDKELVWDDFRIEKLKETYENWKSIIPELLFKSSSDFAIKNWENREEYPDFLGETYNHICEDAVGSIIMNDITQFELDYLNLSKIMLLYQEYIRTDFIKERDRYRTEYIYYMITAPIVEWAQIGGLAILWGEFFPDRTWYEKVNNCAKLIFTNNGDVTNLAETVIKYIQDRDRFMLGIDSRVILETGWNQSVANAIRELGQNEVEYGLYGKTLKTSSKLLKAFCPTFMNMGFTNDPSEVFWVMCVNPLLHKEKQFHTRFSWEDRLNE